MAKFCVDCGEEKKTDIGDLCHPCSMKKGSAPDSWTQNRKDKVSKANTGRKNTPEQIERIRQGHIGLKYHSHSAESYEQAASKNRGSKRTPEQRKVLSEAHKSPESVAQSRINIEKAHESNKGKHFSEERKEHLRQKNKGQFVSLAQRAILRIRQLGKKHRPESIAKMRASAIRSLRHQSHRKTGLEIKVENFLIDNRFNYMYNFPVDGVGAVDFAIGKSVLEADGLYWHTRPGMPEHDKDRDRKLAALGYRVLRLPEYEINKDWQNCCQKILNFLKEE